MERTISRYRSQGQSGGMPPVICTSWISGAIDGLWIRYARGQIVALITDTGGNLHQLASADLGSSWRFVETVAPKAKLQKVPNYDAGVKAVLDDKADALVADYPICVMSVLRFPEAGLATLVSPLTIEPIGVALPADDPLLLNLVQNYLNALQATGVLDALRSKWFEDGSWLSQLP